LNDSIAPPFLISDDLNEVSLKNIYSSLNSLEAQPSRMFGMIQNKHSASAGKKIMKKQWFEQTSN